MKKRVLAIALLLLFVISIVPAFAGEYFCGPWNWRSARRSFRAWIALLWSRHGQPAVAEVPEKPGRDTIADKTTK